MTRYKIHPRIFAAIGTFVIVASFLLPISSFAQTANSTSLTITPPFFELNVNPGDSWSSSIRVVNTNAADIIVHAQVMGFGASDDLGHGNFIPLAQLSDDQDALANWITVSSPAITVPSGGSADVPFSITVPSNASPGGHYAGILIGTGSPAPQPGISQVGVSSFVSALIFVRVSGNIVESANIQQFSIDKPYYQTPDVHFVTRVANTGNVHVRPVGMVQIYNAFGKQRGEIPINETGNLGYVLPSSSREFDLDWHGQASLLDIGPYKAVLSLSYGEDGTKSASETIEFWILPINQLVEVALAFLAIAWLFMFIVKRIVRRMLASEISKYGDVDVDSAPHPSKKVHHHGTIHEEKAKTSSTDSEILDLRKPRD